VDRIVEIGIVLMDNGRVVNRFGSLVNPGISIPVSLTAIHGISNEMVKDAPRFSDLTEQITEMLSDRIFVAHNVHFDYGFLQEEFKSHLKDAIQVIVCEEGEPNGEPQLHYHLYVRAKISESTISMICSRLGRATAEKKGNAVFSVRKAHANTIGYVVKGKKVVYATDDQNVIEKYFEMSETYRKEKESSRKSASRSSKETLDNIVNGVEVDSHSTPFQVVTKILEEYAKLDKKFPPKSLIETAVLKKLYPLQPRFVVDCYAKNLQMTHDNFYGNFR
jgi:DNA polymerase III alpha subunit (gram-positive type)